MAEEFAVRMVNITKTFGHVTANDKVYLELHRGEILSLLGENGSGKQIPDKIQFPGYNEKWKRAVAKDNGEVLKVVK